MRYAKITINVPLFKKLRDLIFFAGQSLYEPFQGTFWGGQDFFDPLKGQFRGQKSRGPLKMSRELAHKVIVPPKKIMSQILKQWYIGNFMSFLNLIN
jgi:hypothetical protein